MASWYFLEFLGLIQASHGNLHITKRKEDKDDHLKVVLKDDIISFEIKIVGPDFIVSSNDPPSFSHPETTKSNV